MKFLANCTVVVHLGRLRSSLLSEMGVVTTESVRSEAGFLLDSAEFEKVFDGVEVLKAGRVRGSDKFLSDTDLELAFLAAKGNYVLVTDDKKLRSMVLKQGGKAVDLPRWIEFLSGREKLPKSEAITLLARLEKAYNRKKDVRKVIARINKR